MPSRDARPTMCSTKPRPRTRIRRIGFDGPAQGGFAPSGVALALHVERACFLPGSRREIRLCPRRPTDRPPRATSTRYILYPADTGGRRRHPWHGARRRAGPRRGGQAPVLVGVAAAALHDLARPPDVPAGALPSRRPSASGRVRTVRAERSRGGGRPAQPHCGPSKAAGANPPPTELRRYSATAPFLKQIEGRIPRSRGRRMAAGRYPVARMRRLSTPAILSFGRPCSAVTGGPTGGFMVPTTRPLTAAALAMLCACAERRRGWRVEERRGRPRRHVSRARPGRRGRGHAAGRHAGCIEAPRPYRRRGIRRATRGEYRPGRRRAELQRFRESAGREHRRFDGRKSQGSDGNTGLRRRLVHAK